MDFSRLNYYAALSDDDLNEAIAASYWRIPDALRDAPYFHHPNYCRDWFESAKIVANIAFNARRYVQERFDATLSRFTSDSAKPRDILLVCAPREVCVAALFALPAVGCSPHALPAPEQ
ncbi:hypothetical protein BUE93_06050 [Chromobacterium amazonense]|uniref:Uncharacterized protein n=1 Tax=Chromobacterium amazonense TaxID=1382803 RepID=A0A2S9X784_9NEIS|nr:hypothetical protein [Chromobacterium amazonense]PRP71553.1 hypothetical protein BUE93_06050 [Chromobacterium amazonense]